MVLDLKPEKIVNGVRRFFVFARDTDFRALRHIRINIANLIVQLAHRRDPGRYRIVDEQRDTEIAVPKHFGDLRQM